MALPEIERRNNPKQTLKRLAEQSHEDLLSCKTREYAFEKFAFDLHALWRQTRLLERGETFLNSISEASKTIETDLPEPLKQNGEAVFGKQQPSLAESIRETAKRLLFFERLVKDSPPSVNGVILGGSISYGPFYNVRGHPRSSDLDIFVIVDQEFFHENHGLRLISQYKLPTVRIIPFLLRLILFPNLI